MYSELACYKNHLKENGNQFDDVSNCPNYGSSGCLLTMNSNDITDFNYCCSKEWEEKLKSILDYR